MRRGVGRIAIATLVAAALTSCSGSSSNRSEATPAQLTTATSAGASAAVVTEPSPILGAGQPIELTCRDSASAGTPPADTDLLVAGLAFSGVSAMDRASAGDAPLDASGHTTFRKVFIYATAAAAATTTLTMTDTTTAALFYQPQYEPSGDVRQLSAEDEIARSTDRVTFEGCGKNTTGYIGGIITSEPSCVAVTVTSSDPVVEPTTVILPINRSDCIYRPTGRYIPPASTKP